LLTIGITGAVFAQDATEETTTEVQDTTAAEGEASAVEPVQEESTLPPEAEEPQGFHQVLKEQFIDGGAAFMGIVLLALIFGLAISIERIIYLNLATTNTKKLLNQVESALETGGIDAAKDVCKTTRGPVAGIFFQGLMRYNEGVEIVEKSIVSYGSVLMGRLESGLSWISLFIALAPMLGFLPLLLVVLK